MQNTTDLLMVLFAFLSCVIFASKNKLMSMLICLELLMFLLLCFIMHTSTNAFTTSTLLALLLCFSASGGAVGLTLLVSMSRLYGNDYVISLIYEKNSRNSSINKIT
uniref:NADH-ubiquinone oxidoreductase chain 4L n=1 Tax=Helix pomatia TaxID=6536 RepID=A0A481ZKX1_HELPO|nr:NADH dehydrogenase subunit 4L [Helix pomatia]